MIEGQTAPDIARMTSAPNTHKPPAIAQRSRPVTAKMREAIRLTVEKGLTGEEAAAVAGIWPSAYWRALARPNAQALKAEMQAQVINGETQLKAAAKAFAIKKAIQMLESETSEQTKVKLVELLTREAPNAPAAVQVNVSNSTGYEFARPNQRIVDITAESGPNSRAPDTLSGGDD